MKIRSHVKEMRTNGVLQWKIPYRLLKEITDITSKCRVYLTVGVALMASPFASAASATAPEVSLPSFLPTFYKDVLTRAELPFKLIRQKAQDGVLMADYQGVDAGLRLEISEVPCDRAACDGAYQQLLQRVNTKASSTGGHFLSVSATEFDAQWQEGAMEFRQYIAVRPNSILSWAWLSEVPLSSVDDQIAALQKAINRQRFDDAMRIDNVMIGLWSKQIHEHAKDLLSVGKVNDALVVLQQVTNWAPELYEAQLDYAEHVSDKKVARNIAKAVWDNTETPELRQRAAMLLGMKNSDVTALTELEKGAKGLQVILIPLPPCDITLVEDVARIYSKYINVPTRIVRLPEAWRWDEPDRLYQQNTLESLIQQRDPSPVDFTGWGMAQYGEKLRAVTVSDDALTRFQMNAFIEAISGKSGQYLADSYLYRLVNMVAPLRSNDRRTMIVGVTQADIYSGNSNFLFSYGGASVSRGLGASILSYARMEAASTGEPYQSRKRLTARLAKELVPATLKQLDIPRPADPTDPYSYSNGVDRLDQKTMILSSPTREALDLLRDKRKRR